MAYVPTSWTDEVPGETPVKYAITGDVEGVISASATIDLATAPTAGTPVNATNLNNIETGIVTLESDLADVDALLAASLPSLVPAGCILPSFLGTAPTGWLLANGQAVSMTTYKALLDALITGSTVLTVYGAGAAQTITVDAGTDEVLWTAHTLSNDDVVMFTNSGGALPGGISANTPYYVINEATNDFQISLTSGGAAVNITDAGTGTHSLYAAFKVPDMRGRVFAGLDNMGGSSANRITDAGADAMGGAVGAETHTLIEAEMPAHNHGPRTDSASGGSTNTLARTTSASGTTVRTGADWDGEVVGGDGAHANVQPSLFGNWIIKY